MSTSLLLVSNHSNVTLSLALSWSHQILALRQLRVEKEGLFRAKIALVTCSWKPLDRVTRY